MAVENKNFSEQQQNQNASVKTVDFSGRSDPTCIVPIFTIITERVEVDDDPALDGVVDNGVVDNGLVFLQNMQRRNAVVHDNNHLGPQRGQ